MLSSITLMVSARDASQSTAFRLRGYLAPMAVTARRRIYAGQDSGG
ncbi:MAG: hypothetical protein ACXIU2_04550 [Cyclobacteriaceae bacterium]